MEAGEVWGICSEWFPSLFISVLYLVSDQLLVFEFSSSASSNLYRTFGSRWFWFLCSEAHQKPERSLNRSVQDPRRQDRAHRERRRSYEDGGRFRSFTRVT